MKTNVMNKKSSATFRYSLGMVVVRVSIVIISTFMMRIVAKLGFFIYQQAEIKIKKEKKKNSNKKLRKKSAKNKFWPEDKKHELVGVLSVLKSRVKIWF
jgi:hypothetical protein